MRASHMVGMSVVASGMGRAALRSSDEEASDDSATPHFAGMRRQNAGFGKIEQVAKCQMWQNTGCGKTRHPEPPRSNSFLLYLNPSPFLLVPS